MGVSKDCLNKVIAMFEESNFYSNSIVQAYMAIAENEPTTQMYDIITTKEDGEEEHLGLCIKVFALTEEDLTNDIVPHQ